MTARPDGTWRARAPAWIAVFAVGFALRLHGLSHHSMWIDECGTLHVATADDWVGALRGDRHPPLSFLAFRAWRACFGEDDAVLRLLPALVSCVSLVLLARLARSWLGSSTAWLAVAVAALSPIDVGLAQEVRMYAFVECATLAALVGACAAMRGPRAWSLALVFASCAVATGLHYFGAFASAAVAAVAWLGPRDAAADGGAVSSTTGFARRAWLVSLAALAGAALWSPWLASMYRDQAGVGVAFQAHASASVFASLPARMIVPGPEFVPESARWLVYASGVAVLIACAAFAVSFARRRRRQDLAVSSVGLAAPLGALAAAVIGPLNFTARYFAVSLPGVHLIVAEGLASIGSRVVRAVLVVATLTLLLATTIATKVGDSREDWRSACAAVERAWRPGDRVMGLTHLEDAYTNAPLRHYLRGRPEVLASMTSFERTREESSPAAYRVSTEHGSRLHVVYRETTYAGDHYRDLTRRFHVVESERWPGGIVRLVLE